VIGSGEGNGLLRPSQGLRWFSMDELDLRLSLRYLLLLVLLFKLPTIMLIDLLAYWNGSLGLLVSSGGGWSRSSR
jgi:hypothetical protein